jgi:F0F1-type ATP synthase assembly protein I
MKNEKDNEPKQQGTNYLKYSGIGFQIAGTAVAGFFIGYQLDKWRQNSKPYFTALLSVLFLLVGLYTAFKDLLKKP